MKVRIAPRDPERSLRLMVFTVCVSAATVMLAFAWRELAPVMWILHGGGETTGTVIELSRRCAKECAAAPVVEFSVENRRYRVMGHEPLVPSYQRGEELPVRYRTAAPEDAQVGTWYQLWAKAVAYVALCLASGSFGLAGYWREWKAYQAHQG